MIDRQRPPVSWMRDGYVARAGSLLASLVARFSARATYPSLIQLTLVAFDFFLFSVPCLPFLHLSAQRRFFFEQPSEPTEGLSNIFRVLDNLCFNALVEFTRFRKKRIGVENANHVETMWGPLLLPTRHGSKTEGGVQHFALGIAGQCSAQICCKKCGFDRSGCS